MEESPQSSKLDMKSWVNRKTVVTFNNIKNVSIDKMLSRWFGCSLKDVIVIAWSCQSKGRCQLLSIISIIMNLK